MRLLQGLLFAIGAVACCAVCLSAFADITTDAAGFKYYLFGLQYESENQIDEAIKQYEKVSQLNPSSASVHLRLGSAYIKVQKPEDATRELQLAVALDPEDLDSRFLLALLYTSLKQFDAASKEYEAVLTIASAREPDNADAHAQLGLLYYQQKRYDDAIVQFKMITAIEPQNVDAFFFLGSLYAEKKDYPQAIGALKKALEIKPEHAQSLNSLGYMYAQQGIYLDEAVVLITKALALEPDNGAYVDSLGWAYFKKGEVEKARQELERAVKLLADPVIFDHLGDVYLRLRNKQDAQAQWKKSLELNPEQEGIKEKLQQLQGDAN